MKNQYSIHELMTLFADGELSETEEQYLFDAIASNAELQSEFKQTLLVHRLLNEIPVAIPSEECDAQLFARAGFDEKKKKRAAMFFLNMKTISSAAAILCVLGAYSLYDNDKELKNVAQINTKQIPIDKVVQSGDKEKISPKITKNPNELQNEQSQHKFKSINYKAIKSSTVSQELSNNVIQHDLEFSPDKSIVSTQPATNDATKVIADESDASNKKDMSLQSIVNSSALQLSQPNEKNNTQRFSSQYFVEARGAMNVSASSPNVSLAGMMKLQEKTWIGLAAGRENMVNLVNNSATANDGDLFGISANKGATRNTETATETIPTIQHWFGAVIERRLGNIVDGIEPTTRLTLGGAESGPFGKLGIGVMMRFSPQFVGTIGIENTGLIYRSSVENSWKSVTTFGGLCSFAIEF